VLHIHFHFQIKKLTTYNFQYIIIMDSQSTSLISAVQNGNVKFVKNILAKSQESIDEKDDYGYTPMRYAIENKDTDMIYLLIEMDTDLRITDCNRDNYLHCAVLTGDYDVVLIFIMMNGDLKYSKNYNNKTPYDYVCDFGLDNLIDLF